jgi:hypothetical protein
MQNDAQLELELKLKLVSLLGIGEETLSPHTELEL